MTSKRSLQPDSTSPHGSAPGLRSKHLWNTLPLTVVLLASGCITDKLTYKMSLDDYQPTGVEGEESQTNLLVSVKGGAGDVLEALSSMKYEWRADGSGLIHMNSSTNVDSTARIEGIIQQQRVVSQVIESLGSNIIGLAGVLVPALTPPPAPSPTAPAPSAEEQALLQALELLRGGN